MSVTGYTPTTGKSTALKAMEARTESTMNGYVAFYKGKRVEVYAKTQYEAKRKAVEQLHVKDSQRHMVTVVLNWTVRKLPTFRFSKESMMKTKQMCKDFLRMRKGQTLDAIEASAMINSAWGIKVDWHEFSDVLTEMLVGGEVNYANERGYDRMTRYIVN